MAASDACLSEGAPFTGLAALFPVLAFALCARGSSRTSFCASSSFLSTACSARPFCTISAPARNLPNMLKTTISALNQPGVQLAKALGHAQTLCHSTGESAMSSCVSTSLMCLQWCFRILYSVTRLLMTPARHGCHATQQCTNIHPGSS